ncbi:GDP-mannose 4,6-dehydratase [Enterococcus sp. DIV0187]|uniref:GDP-mannose 4,6-dehydratase n=1 Tax=Enterococcus sp. DIV0187 TaxID=2774644 RepID=UPI003F210902
MSRILIFGIGGFVGKYLAKEFLDAGYTVIGSDLKEPTKLCKRVTFIKADIVNNQEVFEVINRAQPEMIINLAGISSVGSSWSIPQTTITVNVIGALNILEAVKRYKITSKIMFIGSSEEYKSKNEPMNEKTQLSANNPYGISKITQSNFISLYRDYYGMKIYEVRPFNHTGVGQKDTFVLPSFCKQVAEIEKNKNGGTINVGNLNIKRDFSHVKDIVRAYRLIIESDDYQVVYNVGSGKSYELNDLLNYIIKLSSQNIKIEIDPDRFRLTDTPIIQSDNSLIRSKLGWEPRNTVFDALKEIYEFYLNEEK